MAKVDLNADMGESFGPWSMGDDAALLDIVTSANVACGFHAGDWDVMAATIAQAVARGVGIGAHPGFADLQGFGRQKMDIPGSSLRNLVAYQVAAAQGMARAAGAPLTHVKLHGALANMCAADAEMARHAYEGALSVAPDVPLMVIAATAQATAAQALGVTYISEIFADRAYTAEGQLVDRRLPGAVIHDPAEAAAHVRAMLEAGALLPAGAPPIETPIDTVCCHGDTPAAVAIARAVRDTLVAAGHQVESFSKG